MTLRHHTQDVINQLIQFVPFDPYEWFVVKTVFMIIYSCFDNIRMSSINKNNVKDVHYETMLNIAYLMYIK